MYIIISIITLTPQLKKFKLISENTTKVLKQLLYFSIINLSKMIRSSFYPYKVIGAIEIINSLLENENYKVMKHPHDDDTYFEKEFIKK